MKRAAVVIGLCAGIWGCASNNGTNKEVSSPPSANEAQASAPKKTQKLYLERRVGGTTYVFSSMDLLDQMNRGQKPSSVVIKENFGPDGETVAFESGDAGFEKWLMEEYQKQHPRK